MLTKTFTYGVNGTSISAEVFTETGRTVLAKELLYAKLPINTDDEGDTYLWHTFVRALTQSRNVTGLSFAWPQVTDDVETLVKARDQWLDEIPGEALRRWREALNSVDAPPQKDADLLPTIDGEKKDAPTL